MIDAGIEAQLVNHVPAFVGTAGNADNMAALELGDLPDHRPDGTTCSGNDYGFPGFRLADIEQAHVARKTRHAENAKRQRGVLHVGIEFGQARAVGKGIALPAAVGENQIARLVIRVLRGFNARDGAADQHVADRHRRGVGRRIAHAATHVRVERQVERAQQHLAGRCFRNNAFLQQEVVRRWRTNRTRIKNDLVIDRIVSGGRYRAV